MTVPPSCRRRNAGRSRASRSTVDRAGALVAHDVADRRPARRRSRRRPGWRRPARATGRRTRPAARGSPRPSRPARRPRSPCPGRRTAPARTAPARSAPAARRRPEPSAERSRRTRRRRRARRRAGADQARAHVDGRQPGAALPVDRQPRYVDPETGRERRHPGHVAARAPCSCRAPRPAIGSGDRVGERPGAPAPRGRPPCTSASAPPAVPIGVRRAATTTGRSSHAVRCSRTGTLGHPPARPSAPETVRPGRPPVDLAGVGERQLRDVEPDPRPLRPGQAGRAAPAALGQVRGRGQHDGAATAPARRGAARRRRPRRSPRPQQRLHVGTVTVAPPVVTASSRPSTASRPSASTPAVTRPWRSRRRPRRSGPPRSVVPGADVRRPHPDHARRAPRPPRRGTAAGRRRAAPQATNDSSAAP